MIREIRTGVIGVGSMGYNHARVYNEISNLVAVSDTNETLGREVAKQFGVTWYSDYREMLGELDAVSVAVPTSMHRKVAEEVVEADVHLLVEKPLAGNALDAEVIVAAAELAGVTLAVGHVERHNMAVTRAKNCIQKGFFDKIISMSARRFSSYPRRINDVGVLFDLSIHDVDVICHLVNSDVQTIYAAGGKSRNKKHEDHVTLFMGFENGTIGICESSWLTSMKVRELNIISTDLHINLSYLDQQIKILNSMFDSVHEPNNHQLTAELNRELSPLGGDEPLKRELVDFLESILADRKPLVDGYAGLSAVKIVEAGLKSLETNTIITF